MRRLAAQLLLFGLLFAVLPAAAQEVSVDWDHHVEFSNYHTFSWISVQTPNSIWDERVKEAINGALTAKGFTHVPAPGGDMSIMAISTTSARPTVETFYTGFGGWHWRGFGDAVTTVRDYEVGTLVVDIYDTRTTRLLWRGSASGALADKADKNIKRLNRAVRKMFRNFPRKAE